MDRVTLKESVEKAISYGLAPGTADRIGALARAGKLGTLLWEWRYGGEDREQEAGNLLTRRIAKRLGIRHVGEQGKIDYMRLRLACRQVLREWFSPECDTCNGVKEVSGEHKRVVCQTCNGTGTRRYSDEERAKALKITELEYRKHWDRKFAEIRSMITSRDAETGAVVRQQLREDVKTLEVID